MRNFLLLDSGHHLIENSEGKKMKKEKKKKSEGKEVKTKKARAALSAGQAIALGLSAATCGYEGWAAMQCMTEFP